MIKIKNLRMTYRSAGTSHAAVRDVSIDIPKGHFFTLLGPSGCGKTTILRCVAGLEEPDSGEILIGGEPVFSSKENIYVSPNFRRIGMVFQSYAIWPHMTVFDNVAFPLRHKSPRPSRAQIADMVRTALELVQLGGLEDRPAPFLSGGQQQRLALARALVAEPRVLLLDEPLSNLDAKLREEMRIELRDLVKRLNITTLFVTHEQVEALTMSDMVAVMSEGVIVQQGPPAEIYRDPTAMFVANFVGKTNFLKAKIASTANGLMNVETAIGTLSCRMSPAVRDGETVTVTVRPENVELVQGQLPDMAGNNVRGEVEDVVFLGNMTDCTVKVAGETIRVQLHPSRAPSRGDAVTLRFPVEHCFVIAEARA